MNRFDKKHLSFITAKVRNYQITTNFKTHWEAGNEKIPSIGEATDGIGDWIIYVLAALIV